MASGSASGAALLGDAPLAAGRSSIVGHSTGQQREVHVLSRLQSLDFAAEARRWMLDSDDPSQDGEDADGAAAAATTGAAGAAGRPHRSYSLSLFRRRKARGQSGSFTGEDL